MNRQVLDIFKSTVGLKHLAAGGAAYIRKITELNAEKLKVKLPSGVGSTTFDRNTSEYVVTFAESIEGVI